MFVVSVRLRSSCKATFAPVKVPLTVMLVRACRMMSAFVPSISLSYTVVGLVSPKSAVPFTPEGPPEKLVLIASRSSPSPVPPSMVISAGSRSRVPYPPWAALRSTDPLKTKPSRPETSANPPSPASEPPLALRWP